MGGPAAAKDWARALPLAEEASDAAEEAHVDALYRLSEGYMALGIVSEAQTAAAVLGYNYPNSDWYKDAYQLVSTDGQAPVQNKDSWISKAFDTVNPF